MSRKISRDRHWPRMGLRLIIARRRPGRHPFRFIGGLCFLLWFFRLGLRLTLRYGYDYYSRHY